MLTPTSSSSTPAGSSIRPRRIRSTPSSRPPTPARRSSPWAAWPSATGPNSPSPCGEADAVLGFDSYADIAARLDDVAAGRADHAAHARATAGCCSRSHLRNGRPPLTEVAVPGHAWLPSGLTRARLDDSPVAYLKLASGCDRRCTFCAIPSFRGSFVSRPPADVLDEARWLASTGARELVLVSENSTSYGKDLGDLRALERLLPDLAALDGIDRIRVSYLQPAELRPSLRRGARDDAGRRTVLRPLLPARQRAGTAPDEALRLDRGVPRPARPGPRTRARRRCAQQRHRRLPRRDRGRRRRVGAVPDRCATGRRRRVRLLRRGRHRRGRIRRQARRRRDRRPCRAGHRTRRGTDEPARRGPGRHSVEVLVEEDGAEPVGRAAHQGPDVDGTTRLPGASGPCAAGSSSRRW